MTAATLIRDARRSARLTQRESARRARVSQSQVSLIEGSRQVPSFDTVQKLLRGSGRSLISIPSTREDAAAVATEIASALQSSRTELALRWFIQLNDNLAKEHGSVRFALTIAEPAPTGSKHWDAAIASLAAHHLSDESLPFPSWVDEPGRTLKHRWVLGDDWSTITPPADRVPAEFLRRRVLIDRDTLVSV